MVDGRSRGSIVRNLKLYLERFKVSSLVGKIEVKDGMEDYLFIELVFDSRVIEVIKKVKGVKCFVKFGGDYGEVYESVI